MRATLLLRVWVLTLAFASSAHAFCRSKACDPTQESCPTDPDTFCVEPGAPLFWASGCVDIYVQKDGAPSQGIDWQTTATSLQRAFDTWLGTDCNGAPPSLQVNVMGPIECHSAEYNSKGRNANVVMFREQDWPYSSTGDQLALTQPGFEFRGDGTLWDADIELNAFDFTFDPSGADDGKVDLDSVLTHEVGHWLGLDHSRDREATMHTPFPGGTTYRSLEQDDQDGICAIYPPGRAVATDSCEPRHGFSERCLEDQTPEERASTEARDGGCSLSGQPTSSPGASAACAIFAALAGSCLRRSRRARDRRRARTVV